MNPVLAWSLLAAISLGATQAAAQSVWSVDREQVNVRADATTQSARVTILQRDQEVVEVRRVGQWVEVRLPAGNTGWIHSQLLQERLVIEGEGLRLREAPSTRGTSVTMLFRGQEVGRLGQRDGWTQVRLRNGQSGWVASSFVRAKTAADVAAQRPAQAAAPAPAEASDDAASVADASSDAAASSVEAEASAAPSPDTAGDEFAILQRNPYAEGLQYEASGEHALALARFEEVLETDPAHVNALVHAARAHRQMGEDEAALEKLYRALVASGGRRDVYLTLGEVYRQQGQVDSAARYQALFRGGDLATDTGQPDDVRPEDGKAEDEQVADEQVADAEAAAAPAEPEAPFPGRRVPTARPRPGRDDGPSLGFLDTPWMPIGLAGIGLLALAGVAWWVVSTSAVRHRKAGSGRFQRVWEDEETQAQAGKATPEEEAELDRQIDARWRELKDSAATFRPAPAAAEDGMEGILDQVEGLRATLEGQDERERLYADIVRLQNMKIDAMTEEIRRLRRK